MKHSGNMAARAASELAREMAITVGEYTVFPAEFLDASRWQQLGHGKNPRLLTGRGAYDIQGFSLPELLQLADPSRSKPADLPEGTPLTAFEQRLIGLAKHAGLLPALVIAQNIPFEDALSFEIDALQFSAPQLIETARANLPVAGAENAQVISFRESGEASVHLALVIGAPKEAPLVRLHSSCVTGDLLGSLRCDCGDQLKQAIAQIAEAGSGVLLYLHQEGRDIGITNKLRAYRLQEMGYDTYEANRLLGFGDDERDFSIAASMLKSLGAKQIRLMTNNPQKVETLRAAGINVLERVPLLATPGQHNERYIKAKQKAGHWS